jgi:hypothetical protein
VQNSALGYSVLRSSRLVWNSQRIGERQTAIKEHKAKKWVVNHKIQLKNSIAASHLRFGRSVVGRQALLWVVPLFEEIFVEKLPMRRRGVEPKIVGDFMLRKLWIVLDPLGEWKLTFVFVDLIFPLMGGNVRGVWNFTSWSGVDVLCTGKSKLRGFMYSCNWRNRLTIWERGIEK